MNGITYFDYHSGFSFNEGGSGVNFHLGWKRPFVYIAFLFRAIRLAVMLGGGATHPKWMPRLEFEAGEGPSRNRFAFVAGASLDRKDQILREFGNCHFLTL